MVVLLFTHLKNGLSISYPFQKWYYFYLSISKIDLLIFIHFKNGLASIYPFQKLQQYLYNHVSPYALPI